MKQWYSIQAKAGRTAKVNIFEQIGRDFWDEGVSAKRFVEELDALDVDTIDLHINSPGGEVWEGNAIYNALRQHQAVVNVTVDGVAASIASVIAMAGDTVRMSKNALMMIHDPMWIAVGTAEDMRKRADALDKVKDTIVSSYMTRAKEDRSRIEQMMSEETWLTAREAVAVGLADEIVGEAQLQNCAFNLLSRYRNVPPQILNMVHGSEQGTPKPSTSSKESSDMEITLEKIKSEYPDIAKALFEEGKAAGMKEGAKAELARIEAVRAQALPGHEALVAEMVKDGVTTGEQAAMRILQAEKQLRDNVKNRLDNDAGNLPPVPPSAPPEIEQSAEDLSTEEGMQAYWDKNKSLRDEFGGDFEAFKAYQEAVNKGLVKVLKK